MSPASRAKKSVHANYWGWCLLLLAMLVTGIIYSAGLSGSYLFDDYPNIVDNHAVQPTSASLPSLVGAALSSASSEFKRPLASLSFAANYLASGLNPYWMKLTNLVIHLLNGLLVFLLAGSLLRITTTPRSRADDASPAELTGTPHTGVVAALIAASWMLLPINLTAVLYVVQRMESMANLFVLLGLIGYTTARRRMLETSNHSLTKPNWGRSASMLDRNFILCLVSITVPTALGILAKETAIMLPLYALLIEWALFRFGSVPQENSPTPVGRRDPRIVTLFLLVLVLPMVWGLAWLIPGILKPATWATRDFTLATRLLSEARIVVDYLIWTLLPTPHALSFYHDDYAISTGLLTPWTTSVSIIFLALLIALTLRLRARYPLVALGLALFLGCQLLTATVIPLELIYEHRNYFASFGLLLAVVPLLAVTRSTTYALPRHVLLVGLILSWAALTNITAYAWGNPLRLAEDLALRAPQSPRAQYELGRTYIIYSNYDPTSPFTKLAYPPLEKSASLPDSSILAEQALIFMNARMHLPLKDAWWQSMITKLHARKSTVQDESSLGALTQCADEHHCELPSKWMTEAYLSALSHPNPSARLLAMYGDYAWNVLNDHQLGLRMTEAAIKASPKEPAYQITLIRMLAAEGRKAEANNALKELGTLDIGGRLNISEKELRTLPGLQ
jgi:protein O-mannosyl-transferase